MKRSLQDRIDDLGIDMVTCCSDGGCMYCEYDREHPEDSRAARYGRLVKQLREEERGE